ncbi:hypothetical protein AURDEDRAFT_161072 [Auricularia subglabra TFB-10046 SS5]|nr:hypothetical protein AURDEDRAFT_161072 [Auricularia subglabra TFB-10046 SS5]
MILDLDDEVYDGKLGFIEDERGQFVGVRIVNNITALARLIFCQFVELGIWPRYWRRISMRAFALFAMRMYESYPFLRLCAGDWKVRAIGRDQYSGWFNKNPELKALAASSNIPDLEVDEDDEEEVAPVRSKRRRTKQVDALRPRKRQKTVQAPAQLEAGPGEGPVPLPLGAR